MCKECGCGLPSEAMSADDAHPHDHDHGHAHAHDHPHDHEHPHSHTHGHSESGLDQALPTGSGVRRTLEVRRAILDQNDRRAERNRGFFKAKGLLVLNVLSSPGSGKTTFIQRTIQSLAGRLQCGVIVGDLATDNDAQRLRVTGAPVRQITTGTVCHLEAEMVARALGQMDLTGLELLVIENVGNLVCPASYDLGEDLRVVLLSVTEGEDKPLKYPPLFQSAHVVVISKTDLAVVLAGDRDLALANLRRVVPQARVFETSAKTGQGLEAWSEFLAGQHRAFKAQGPFVV